MDRSALARRVRSDKNGNRLDGNLLCLRDAFEIADADRAKCHMEILSDHVEIENLRIHTAATAVDCGDADAADPGAASK